VQMKQRVMDTSIAMTLIGESSITTEALCESKHKGKVVEGVTCKTSFAVIEAGSEEECTTVYYGEVLPG